MCINKEKNTPLAISFAVLTNFQRQIKLCVYINKSDHTTEWLIHCIGCISYLVWYVLDTCWNNIFNRKQCSTVGYRSSINALNFYWLMHAIKWYRFG